MKFAALPRRPQRRAAASLKAAALLLSFAAVSFNVGAQEEQQKISGYNRERAMSMLGVVKSDLKKNYYDEKFRGIDLDARFKEAEGKIKAATSLGQALGIIAQTLVDFNDSHLYFVPPSRPSRVDYGWQMQMIGDKCYVSAVRPGSDADKKGLRPGDEVWTIDGYGPGRENLWKMKYFYYSLRPRAGMVLVVRKPDGKEEQHDVMAKVRQGKQVMDLSGSGSGGDIWQVLREAEQEDRLDRHRFVEIGEELFIWKMPQFDMGEAEVDDMMSKVRKRKALILDLRGNGGGYVRMLERLVGHFIDRDLKIADLKGRKEMKPLMAKTHGDKVFKGQVFVLVDSESGSAAELFARIMQLEKRGLVIGDRTSGKVMQSRYHGHELGVDTVSFYGVSVTNADVIMADGQSLENTGVAPDQLMLPTPADMAAKRDPVLAHAAALAGIKLDPMKAGTLFPLEWRK